MDALFGSGDSFAGWLLRTTWQGSVLIVLVLVTQWLLGERIAARWRYTLWLLVVVRLALPFSLESRVSVFNWLRTKPAPAVILPQVANSAPTSAEPAVGRSEAASQPQEQPSPSRPSAPLMAEGQGTIPLPPVGPEPGSRLEKGLLCSWLTGCALLTAYLLISANRLGRRVRRERLTTDSSVLNLLEDCKQQMQVRTPLHLVETREVTSPSLYGFIRPRLLLPAGLTRSFSVAELRYVFLHELAHVKRADIPLNWLMTALLIVHWFNPLVWFAFSRMRVDRELACDALALSCAKDSEKHPYGQTIIRLLESFSSTARVPALAGILETKNQINRRIAMIATFSKTNRKPVLALSIIACLAFLALTDAQSQPGRKPVKLAGKPPADLAVLRVWSCTNSEMSSAMGISSDGRYMAYTDGDTGDLMVRDLFKGKNQRLTRIPPADTWKEYVEQSVISPDGSKVAYTWSGRKDLSQLRVINRDGTGSRVLYEHSGTGWFWLHGWSADGRQLIAVFKLAYEQSSEKQIALISVQDGSKRVLTRPRDIAEGVALSPDGRFLVYDTQARTDSKNREIRLVPVEGGEEVSLVAGPWNNQSLGWSADGRYLLFGSNRRGSFDCWAQRMEGGKPQGQPELVKADLGSVSPMGITRGGGFYYRTEIGYEEVQVAKLDLDTGHFIAPPTSLSGRYQSHDWQAAWSPDGKQLAYISIRNGSRILCVRSMPTGQEREYSLAGANFHWAAWSADGKSIRLLTTQLNEDTDTFRLDLASGGLQRLNTGEIFAPMNADENLALRFNLDAPQQILVEDLRSGAKKVLYTFAENEGHSGRAVSPNDQQLAFMCVREEPAGWSYRLKVVPLAGGEVRQALLSTNNITAFGWLADNRRLLCCSGKEFLIVSTDGAAPRRLGPAPDCYRLSLHPDGQQLAFSVAHSQSELWLLENAVPSGGSGKLARAQR